MPSNSRLSHFLALSLSILIPLTSSQGDQNALACSLIQDKYTACAAAIPGFITVSPQSQAACLCYSSSVWIADAYDSYWTSCLAEYSTANPDALASARAAAGGTLVTAPCRSAGNVLTLPEGTPSIPITNPSYAACATLESKELSCASAIPGYASMSFSDQASCVCYSGRVWEPQSFDDLWGSCVGFLSTETAFASAYSAILSAQGGATIPTDPCQNEGDVLAGTTSSSPSSTSASPAAIPSSGATTTTDTETQTSPATTSAPTSHGETNAKHSLTVLLLAFLLSFFPMVMF